jgi:flagellar FliL protein
MKALTPLLIALLGLGAGIGGGLLLKPHPETEAEAACGAPEAKSAHAAEVTEPAEETGEAIEAAASEPCPPATVDPFKPAPKAEKKPAAELAYVPMDKPFVVPVFAGEKVKSMVVVSLSVETETEAAPEVEAVKPRLRDSFLKVMFRHANSGGFDGSFTAGRKMEDLKSALLIAAREVMATTPVEEVLITEIARQDE